MRRALVAPLSLALSLACAAPAFADEGQKPGRFAVHELTTSADGEPSVVRRRTTVADKKVEPGKVELDVSVVVVKGKPPAEKPGAITVDVDAWKRLQAVGEEDLHVLGHHLHAKRVERKLPDGAVETTWYSSEVPGEAIVRRIRMKAGHEVEREELVDWGPVPAPGTGLLGLVSAGAATWDGWWGVLLGAGIPLLFIALFLLPIVTSVFPMFAIWLERKVSAHMQSRLGPMECGWHGWLQTLADGVKLMGKEDLIPAQADKALFILGPVITLMGVFLMLPVLPFGPHVISVDLDNGLFFLAAVGSIEVIGILMAGWASNNKWAVFGTMRLATQLVSYEIPLGLPFLTVAALAGSLSMQEIVREQHGWIWNWFLFRNPFMAFLFVIYFTASLAETKRAPFDLPEAESELVAGFHTEYSGMRFSIFFLAEYIAMYIVAAIAGVIFLGGWHTGIGPLDQWLQGSSGGWGGESPGLGLGLLANLVGMTVVFAKAWALIFVQMWLRWTLPRIRLDQVMDLCLKVLIPFSVAFFVLSIGWELIPWKNVVPAGLPYLQDRLPRFVIFLIQAALVAWWLAWFWTTFQAPLKRSVKDKPWLVPLKAEGAR